MLRRAAHESLPGAWQPVTGSIRRGENALRAARREVREETGLEPLEWWRLESVVSYLDVASDKLCVVALFAAEVDPAAKARLSREHDSVRYVTLARAAAMVLWDTQRDALRSLRSQIFGGARLAAALKIDDHAAPRARGRSIRPPVRRG